MITNETMQLAFTNKQLDYYLLATFITNLHVV